MRIILRYSGVGSTHRVRGENFTVPFLREITQYKTFMLPASGNEQKRGIVKNKKGGTQDSGNAAEPL